MRWFGFACLLSVLSHLGVRSHQISNFPFSLLSQYCQISVSPRQVRARGIPVGQQAFSGKFHVGGNCSGRWTSCGFLWNGPVAERGSCRPELLPHAGFTGVCREGKCAARACVLQAIGCPTASWCRFCLHLKIQGQVLNSFNVSPHSCFWKQFDSDLALAKPAVVLPRSQGSTAEKPDVGVRCALWD